MPDEAGGGKPLRILGFIALCYWEKFFWPRDLGLIILRLREMGHDAWLVALKNPNQTPEPGRPVIEATAEELGDPAWWRQQAPDAIILNAWGVPRWDAIRRAAASLGKPIVEKLDTDGVKSPRIWFGNALGHHCFYPTSASRLKKALRITLGFARTLLVFSVPAVMDARMARTMSSVPVYAAETPLASERVRRFLRLFGARPMPRVVTIPHPVNSRHMVYSPDIPKENLVIAVGRWRAANKGWALLLAAANKFLRLRPEWRLVVVGEEPLLSASDRAEIESFQGRLAILGQREPAQLAELYRRARIFLFPSVWESFNIAAAEALCCGCTVVGPTRLASVSYFTSFRSGTPSHVRSPDHVTDALLAEVHEWEDGQRDPAAISRTALSLFSVDTIAQRFIDIFHNWDRMAPAREQPERGGQG